MVRAIPFASSAPVALLRRLTVAVLALGLMCGLGGCEKPRLPLVIGANPWPGYEGLFIARDQGLVDEGRVRVLDFPSTGEVMRAFRNGTLDAAAVTLDEALSLRDTGEQVKVVLVFDISAGADALLARPPLNSLAALRGRRIGLEANTTSSLLLARALEKTGLAAADVTVVPLPLDAQQRALARGEVDAVATFEPVRSQLEQAGARVLFDSTAMPNEIVDVLLVRQSTLEARPDDLAVLIKAWGQAQQRLARAEPAVVVQGGQRSGIAPDLFRHALQGMRLPDLPQNQALLASGGLLSQQVGQLGLFMTARGWLKHPFPADLVDDRLVRRASHGPQPGDAR